MLNIKDVCGYLQISRSTLYRLIAKNALKPYKIGNGLRFKREEIEDYLRESQKQQP